MRQSTSRLASHRDRSVQLDTQCNLLQHSRECCTCRGDTARRFSRTHEWRRGCPQGSVAWSVLAWALAFLLRVCTSLRRAATIVQQGTRHRIWASYCHLCHSGRRDRDHCSQCLPRLPCPTVPRGTRLYNPKCVIRQCRIDLLGIYHCTWHRRTGQGRNGPEGTYDTPASLRRRCIAPEDKVGTGQLYCRPH